jgi:hypothetical protein
MPQQHPNTRADSATSAPKGHILWLATALLTAQGALCTDRWHPDPASDPGGARHKHQHKHNHDTYSCLASAKTTRIPVATSVWIAVARNDWLL